MRALSITLVTRASPQTPAEQITTTLICVMWRLMRLQYDQNSQLEASWLELTKFEHLTVVTQVLIISYTQYLLLSMCLGWREPAVAHSSLNKVGNHSRKLHNYQYTIGTIHAVETVHNTYIHRQLDISIHWDLLRRGPNISCCMRRSSSH